MRSISICPDRLPGDLAGLGDLIAAHVPDSRVVPVPELSGVTITGEHSAVIVFTDLLVGRGVRIESLIDDVAHLGDTSGVDLVFIVGDGYLGTDGDHLKAAGAAAATIALARSLAVRRGRTGRSNVICVPDPVFGNQGSQRSPLSQAVEAIDIAGTIAYLLDDSGLYINGQVIYVDGGRHLFSSHTA